MANPPISGSPGTPGPPSAGAGTPSTKLAPVSSSGALRRRAAKGSPERHILSSDTWWNIGGLAITVVMAVLFLGAKKWFNAQVWEIVVSSLSPMAIYSIIRQVRRLDRHGQILVNIIDALNSPSNQTVGRPYLLFQLNRTVETLRKLPTGAPMDRHEKFDLAKFLIGKVRHSGEYCGTVIDDVVASWYTIQQTELHTAFETASWTRHRRLVVVDFDAFRKVFTDKPSALALLEMCKWHAAHGFELSMLVCADVGTTMSSKLSGCNLRDFGVIGKECVFGTANRMDDKKQDVYLYEQGRGVEPYLAGFEDLWELAHVSMSSLSELEQLLTAPVVGKHVAATGDTIVAALEKRV